MDRIIALLPIEPKKKTVVMFCDDIKLMNLIELLSCFDTSGESVSLKIDKNIDELCMSYLYKFSKLCIDKKIFFR